MKTLKILLCGLLLALPVFAEETEDRQTATSLQYVSHELDTRQDKLSAGADKALTYTNTAGNIEQRTVKSDLTGGTTDTSLPLVNAVNDGLSTKQDDIDPINDHTAVTYTSQIGTIGQKGIYQDSGTYSTQYDNLIDAKTFNAALKKGLDSEFVCGGTSPNGTCWLWQIHNETENSSTKNLLDPSFMNNSTYGNITVYGLNFHDAKILPTEGGKTYTLSATLTPMPNGHYYYYLVGVNSDGTKLPSQCPYMWNNSDATTFNPERRTCTFTVANDAKYVVYFAMGINDVTLTDYQMEEGATATPYEPYGNLYIPQNQ